MQFVPGEPLLLAIATISVVVAGFTAVTSTLAPTGGTWHPAMRIRQRAIVSTSFNVMFESLAPPIAFAATGDQGMSMIVASAGAAIYTTGIVYWRGRQIVRAGGPFTTSGLLLFGLGPAATLLFWANALIFHSVGVYALALSIQLSVAAVSFYSLVSAAQADGGQAV